MLQLLLFVFAFVLFLVAGLIAVPEPWHNKLVCLGLACLTLALAIPTLHL